jgi:Sap, sulfolipid-1-addressing protein
MLAHYNCCFLQTATYERYSTSSRGQTVSDLLHFLLAAVVSAINPALLAVVTAMLLLPNPKRLMIGYLVGAYVAGLGAGLAIVFSLRGTSVVSTSRHQVAPGEDLAIGLLLLFIAYLLWGRYQGPIRQWWRERKAAQAAKQRRQDSKHKESWDERMLKKGSVGVTFVVGLVTNLPSAAYIGALGHIAHLNPGVVPTILLVVAFCVVQFVFAELPLVGYIRDPERTEDRVNRFKAWLSANSRRIGTIIAAGLGVLLIVRAVIAFIV